MKAQKMFQDITHILAAFTRLQTLRGDKYRSFEGDIFGHLTKNVTHRHRSYRCHTYPDDTEMNGN